MKAKVIVLLTVMALCANECSSSAIPMWEYLSRDEKVSKFHWSGGISETRATEKQFCVSSKKTLAKFSAVESFFFGFSKGFSFCENAKDSDRRKAEINSLKAENWIFSLICNRKATMMNFPELHIKTATRAEGKIRFCCCRKTRKKRFRAEIFRFQMEIKRSTLARPRAVPRQIDGVKPKKKKM